MDKRPIMHVNMATSMSYIVSSQRTSRLPACMYVCMSQIKWDTGSVTTVSL